MPQKLRRRSFASLLTLTAAIILPNLAASGGCPVGVPGLGGPPAALLGTWRAQFVDPTFGAGQVELIIMADGTFQQQTIYAAGALVTIFGTVRVLPDQAILRLDTQGGVPQQACGPLGCTDILYPGETHNYSLPNANNLTTHNINCAANACTYNYVRIT
ncbi:MAG: hypothetical protein AABZ08_03850 [Planctomycetota bacterium]